MSTSLSVVIPTYKEQDNIAPLVERIAAALQGHQFTILFVDDDSRDGTEELVNELARKYPVRIMVRKNKRGLASAVVDGIQATTTEAVAVMDADLQHPPEILPELVKRLDAGADMAIASRYVPGGGCEGWGLARRVNSKGAIMLAHLLLPATRRIKDPMSGYFAFKRQGIAGAALKPAGYKIILEVLMLGKFEKVVEVPFAFVTRQRGKSKLSAKQQIEYLRHLYSLMQRTGELRRFFSFAAVGVSGILVNQGLLWLLTEFAGLYYLVSSLIGIEASIISNFLLNDCITFRDRCTPGMPSFFRRLLKFNTVSLGGLLINWGVLWLFTNVFGVHYLISNLVGIGLAFLWNYSLNTWWTWR